MSRKLNGKMLYYVHKYGYILIRQINNGIGGCQLEKQLTIAEAKSSLPAIIHSVEEGTSVKLTRYGKPIAVLLSIREYEQFAKNNMGFWSAYTPTLQKPEGFRVKRSPYQYIFRRFIPHSGGV
jgi:prevent-host-death family protein